MLGDLIGFVAIVALIVVVWRQQQRLHVLEFDLDGLRKAFLAHREAIGAGRVGVVVAVETGVASDAVSAGQGAPAEAPLSEALPVEAIAVAVAEAPGPALAASTSAEP